MSAFARKLKPKRVSAPSRKLLRLPDGTTYKCDKKVRVHNVSDLRVVATKIGFERDTHFFFVTKNDDGLNLLPSCFPKNPSVLLDHISRIYFLYHLSESSVSKCLSMENPKDLTDTHLLNDVVLMNRNNLQANPEDVEAAKIILDSEQAVVRLLGTLLSLPDLITLWYRIKDEGGKVYQLGIASNGLLLRPEFETTETSKLNWSELDMPRIHRAIIRVPLKPGTVVTDNTILSFLDYKKNKRMTLTRRRPSQSSQNIRNHGDAESCKTIERTVDEDTELVFVTPDSFTAKRLTYQLNCARTYAVCDDQAGLTAGSPTLDAQRQQQQQPPSSPFSRINRQFRDTFRRVTKPFSKKTKKSATSEQEESGDELFLDMQSQTMGVSTMSCPNDNQALVDASGDGPYTLSSNISPIPATTSATARMASTNDPEHMVTSSNQVVRPTGAIGSKTPTSSSTLPSTPSVPTKLPIGSHTATTGIVGSSPSSTIAHTFHVSHNLPHGASFQTHGSVIPVLPVPSRAAAQESPVEPIGVVAAGEADFSLDECEDRMLKSLPSPVFESAKVSRSPPTTPLGPTSPNTYSLGIKSTAIPPVTPTSPSSLTSFGASTHSTQPTQLDRSPVSEDPSMVSAALAKYVMERVSLNESSTIPEPTADREFCADVLAETLKVEPETVLTTPSTVTAESTVPLESARKLQTTLDESTKITSVTTVNSDEVSLTSTHSVHAAINQTAVLSNVSGDLLSDYNDKPNMQSECGDGQLSPETAVPQIQSFSASTTSSSVSTTESPRPQPQSDRTINSVADKVDHSPSPPSHTSVSTFGQSELSGGATATSNSQHTKQSESKSSALSSSSSFQSRLRAPMISVPRPGTTSESDTWSRTPEFPAPYRPVSSCSTHAGLHSTKGMAPEPTVADQPSINRSNTSVATEVFQTSHAKTVNDLHTKQGPETHAHTQSVCSSSSTVVASRTSGIRPPSVKVPGSSPNHPSIDQTRLEGSIHPSNGTPPTAAMASVPDAHVSTHKATEVKTIPSGIRPPSVGMNMSTGSRATGIPAPNPVATNGTGGKNVSASSLPTATAPTGIRPPSRVPKPSTDRA